MNLSDIDKMMGMVNASGFLEKIISQVKEPDSALDVQTIMVVGAIMIAREKNMLVESLERLLKEINKDIENY